VEAPVRVEVDGEVFDVVVAGPDSPGAYHYTWASGRNPGYGFTSARSDGRSPAMSEHEESIRDFLSQIDPGTGYLED
jgi:hypothetical protein